MLLVVFVVFIVPETRRVSLEEMDTLFGGANHVEKGGDMLHVEDVHHAHIGQDNVGHDTVTPVTTHHEVISEKQG